MIRQIPPDLHSSRVTTSEQRVHAALKRSSLTGIALHSLNLPEHEYKLTAEIDFVVILESIVLVIEVKGGQVSRNNGVWTYSDRKGNFRQSYEGPFKQADSGMYALRARLRERLGPDMPNVAFGYLVVTTDVDLLGEFEWAREAYCGRAEFARDFDRTLTRTQRYWLGKQPHCQRLSAESRALIARKLRSDFDRSPLLDARVDELDRQFQRLTDEQYERLDVVLDAPRVLSVGGAGSGKTLIAAEIARREALRGSSVAFICRSELLAASLRNELSVYGVQVITASTMARHQFDVLVVDEAQDLMNMTYLEFLDNLVKGGLQNGRWVMFLDPNHQAHVYEDFDADALTFIQSFAPAPGTLKRNCRNTREIAYHVRAHTGADTGMAIAGSGPDVQLIAAESATEEASALDRHVTSLLDQHVRPSDIAVLSFASKFKDSSASTSKFARDGRLVKLTTDNVTNPNTDEIVWSTVTDFKGLERRFICVVDIDELRTETDIDRLYVAMSRPRVGLWIAMKTSVARQMADLFLKYSEGAKKALERN